MRNLAPLLVVTAAALVFVVLLVLVLLRWSPLESADQAVAGHLTGLLAGHSAAITAIKAVTTLGNTATLVGVIAVVAVILAIRRRWRLLLYVVVTAAGAFIIDPLVKAAVGRLRPVVAHPVAHALGKSFPSGHALDSLTCYGAVLLVCLPAVRGRWRPALICAAAVLVALIGFSRILLGVHFVSDVLAGWALAVAWLGITATVFELSRYAAGQRITDPVTEGLTLPADEGPADREQADQGPADQEQADQDAH
jgi:membrane-associated phospholipid phosphatase